MATQRSILTWKTPWIEKPGRLQSIKLQESGMTKHVHSVHTDDTEK